MSIFSIISLHDIYLVFFSLGLAFAAGAALVGNLLFVTATKDRRISEDECALLRTARTVMWFGYALYGFAGIGLFTLSYEAMLRVGIFQAAMVVSLLLFINLLVFQFHLLPALEGAAKKGEPLDAPVATRLILSEVISLVSWLFLVIHHALYRAPFDVFTILAIYVSAIVIFGYTFFIIIRRRLTLGEVRYFFLALMLCLAVTIILVFLGKDRTSPILSDITRDDTPSFVKTERPTFTLNEVAGHAHVEDCWVVIYGGVYDVTPAAEKFPDVYACGKDSTDTYAAVNPDGISDRLRSYQIGVLGFGMAEVSTHNKKDDCWLVIDGLVFDATPQSKLHPAAFNCGTDATINYHRNHGKDISEKMMELHIGYIDDGVVTLPDQALATTEKRPIEPTAELFVPVGSWDTSELMVIVEKDVEKLLFVDGRTHTNVGRIHDVGFQPHTSVYSPDARYMYIIARNGWLTKIDLSTLEPVTTIDVGVNSRGTALTDDGKFLAIGNYEPGNVVIVDPATMTILKVIDTVGEINGETVTSRVGAVVQRGSDIIVALKDLNSVWVINAAAPDFPVKEKYWNIGGNETPLHDAYLTPDGKFYLVASMGSDTVWVLDTDTWEPVGEVKTGDTPHTGPGATWKNVTYVPAIGEGLITAINTDTWQPIAYIKTAGPGLFIRSYHKNYDYPYVWADTAFGEFHDEIYVIDARTNSIAETLRPVPGESSWHPEFTYNGKFVYVVSQTGNQIVVYDADDFSVVTTIAAETPSAVSNVGLRIEEPGL